MEEVQKVILAFEEPRDDSSEGNLLGDETAEYFDKKFKK